MRGELKFLAGIPFKSITLFRLSSSRAALLDLNNLSLVSLFAGSVYLIPCLFADEVAAFQPLYSVVLPMEDLRLNYVIFSLRSTVLPHNFAPLSGSLFIYGPTPLYRLMSEVIWFPGFVFRCFCYIFMCFLSLVNAFVPYLSPWVPFISPGGFVPINLSVRPFVYVSVGAFGPMGNWVESMEREDFMEMEESFNTPTPIISRRCWGAEFIIEESLSEQNPLPIIGVSAHAKGKRKVISPPPSFEEMRRGGGSLFMVVEEFPTLNNVCPLEVNWCYHCISWVITWVYDNNEPVYIYISP